MGHVDARKLCERLDREAEASGYHLNPDPSFTMELCEGLATNVERYGYPLCPCRLTGGSEPADRDIICPCDYRDSDLDEFDTCY
jgi:ferredoxin-thioredoxin reductase catalytic subunit